MQVRLLSGMQFRGRNYQAAPITRLMHTLTDGACGYSDTDYTFMNGLNTCRRSKPAKSP